MSSVDEFDSVSIKGRREEFEARKALVLNAGKSEDVDVSEGNSNNSSREDRSKHPHASKMKGITANKSVKKGKIRFKEESATTETQKFRKGRRKTTKNGQGEEETNVEANDLGEPKEEKRNKYLDEWLGIKRVPIDTRYQPGKPPPNRRV